MSTNKENSIEEIKIAFIYGKENIDETEKNGSIEKIYKKSITNDFHHYLYMKNFGKNNFINNSRVQSAIEATNEQNPDAVDIFFEIQKLGHIVFQEVSTPPYKMGIIYIPKNEIISNEQRKTLKKFCQQLISENYTIIKLENLHKGKDGTIKGSTSVPGKASDLLQEFIIDSDELELEH